MTNSEVISIGISVSAFVISVVTLYLTFFHKKISMIGTFAACYVPDNDEEQVEVEYSLGNTGNQELLIKGIELNIDSENESHSVPEIQIGDIPAVV